MAALVDRLSSSSATLGRLLYVVVRRRLSGEPSSVCPYVRHYKNRNPRNLELLGLEQKTRGFETERSRSDYYHRLKLILTNKHTSAVVNHRTGQTVVQASTREFAIAKHLYKTCDVSASRNIGQVMAHRMKEFGMTRVWWERSKSDRISQKVKAFLEGLQKEGIQLTEPRQFHLL